MIDVLKSLYGDDIFNIALKIILEIILYSVSSIIGAILRELKMEKKFNGKRMFTSTIFISCLLFICGNYLKNKISDTRLLFGIGVILWIYIPSLSDSIKSGKIFIVFIKIFNRDLGLSLEETFENKQKNKCKDKCEDKHEDKCEDNGCNTNCEVVDIDVFFKQKRGKRKWQ